MTAHAKVLRVESSTLILHDSHSDPTTGRTIACPPPSRPWQRLEAMVGLRLHVARKAKQVEAECDVIWADNENTGIALSLLRVRKPMIVVAHHLESPLKQWAARVSGVVDRWSGIGTISTEGRQFLIDAFHVPPERLFQYMSAKYLRHPVSTTEGATGAILSVGVAKRDYATLVSAVRDLPECAADIYASSRYGDVLRFSRAQSTNVRQHGWVEESVLIDAYKRARFVVVPMHASRQHSAGATAALEASALGKAVIATRTCGMASFVNHGETGLLVPPANPGALRDAIRALWGDPAACAQMGAAGRRYVSAHFDPTVVDAKIAAFVDGLRTTGAR